ncbi:hypothetical protein [Seleniivibrio sp.]|uniref:hypothetical protein n=1 Tax=Seleniivibrio sp. TaxID=2898801 RepID=UPI0025CCC00D|nr:hypothetical protein [Seleniivibrio sp.]MCD8553127.1 hypothetical protein [Seleniivibrio sp.]
MFKNIRLILIIAFFCASMAHAGDDDYILGLNAFGDGLYSIAAPALETYLKGGQEVQKRNYAKYLLYKTYMKQGKTADAQKYLKEIADVDDSRFDKVQMSADNMSILTSTDCAKASAYAAGHPQDGVFDVYLDSKCTVDDNLFKAMLDGSKSESVKMKLVSKFTDKPEMVNKVFDSTPLSTLSASSKRYFGVFFYRQKDFVRFDKVKADYMDADLAGLELDRYWVKGDKQGYMDRFAALSAKYDITGAPVCRAIELYNEAGRDFDCNLVNKCITEYTVEFVKVKGACLAGKKDPKAMTAFADSLGTKIFSGLCGYGEYIFANSLYTGEKESKFAACDNKFHIADVMAQKRNYKGLVNMFKGGSDDMDRYYTAIGYAGLGKKKEASETAAKIKDAYLRSKLSGAAK